MENNTNKSGKAGYIITIIFLIIVIIVLSVLFAFKETLFPVANHVNTVDTNTLVSNTIVENQLAAENIIAQTQTRLINSIKGYWISSTNDQFLSIVDSNDNLEESTINFSLIGGSGIVSTTCTIDSSTIKTDSKTYNYAVQGNNLILSHDNVTCNFVQSNYYQLSKQSKYFYANMMGYQVPASKIPTDSPITGDYTNKALLGKWQLSNGNAQLIFSLKNNNLVVSKINSTTRESVVDMPVGMNSKYIDFVDTSALEEELYSYQIKDDGTLVLSSLINKSISEYKKINDGQDA